MVKCFEEMFDSLKLVKLHERRDLFSDCATLLNEEWPRSLTARLHSLEKSCDSLPLSMVLIDSENRLLGHIRVKKEFMDNTCAFIESLIVAKSERGKGFGKYIMKETEQLIKDMGFKTISLTTTNKMDFYKSLGFVSIQSNANLTAGQASDTCAHKQSPIGVPLPPPPPPSARPSPLDKVLMFKNI